MKTLTKSWKLARAFAGIVACLALLLEARIQAAVITLSSGDAAGFSSFTNGTHWSTPGVPSAGNTYVVSGPQTGTGLIRAPGDSVVSAYTFGGDSLTLFANTAGQQTQLRYKSTADQSLTVNLIMQSTLGTATVDSSSGGGNPTLNGTINVTGPGLFQAPAAGKIFTLNSTLSGSGSLTFNGGGGGTSFLLTSANNTLSGGITVGNGMSLTVTANGGLGSGNVTLFSTTSKLVLSSGSDNNFFGDTANLILPTGLASGAVNLNFTGIDILGGISLDGGLTTLTASGTYGAVGSGADFTSTDFTGTGLFQIAAVPEPATFALLGMGSLMLLLRRRR